MRRQTDRQTDTLKTDRQTVIQKTDRRQTEGSQKTDIQTYIYSRKTDKRQTHGPRQTERDKDGETDKDMQAGCQRHRQVDNDAARDTYRHRLVERQTD